MKETSIYINDDLTTSRAKVTRDLRSKDDLRGVTVTEKIIVFMRDNQKLVFDKFYKLQKRDNKLFSKACNI